MNLIFLKPEAVPEASVLDYKAEHLRHGEDKIHGSALLDALDYAEWLQRARDNADARTVLAGWAVASTFFAVREADGRIVGMADIRHSLESAFLRRYGGHIGYGVRPTERRKGYATRILRMALDYARSLSLDTAMLGCTKENAASRRTILRCGGVLEREDVFEGSPVEIYRIDLRPGSQEQAVSSQAR